MDLLLRTSYVISIITLVRFSRVHSQFDGGFGSSPNNDPFGNNNFGSDFSQAGDSFDNNAGFGNDAGQIDQNQFNRPFDLQGNSRGLCPNIGSVPDFSKINWNLVDRRCEEGWWHLYPFGERYFDTDFGLGRDRLWHDKQIDLDFFLPYYGFRFNYTFIYPEGFIAFSYPRYIQPPYTFPSPRWPDQPDPSMIAAFLSPQSFMYVGETGISHVWYRIISRPIRLIQNRLRDEQVRSGSNLNNRDTPVFANAKGRPAFTTYGSELLKIQNGRVEDPVMLDIMTRDLREGMVGARGFTADYALLVTWERMGYGGAPKSTALNQYNDVKTWQNTYQMVVLTDEIRTYTMFNYANVNWTSSTAAGAFSGRGGLQSAVVGFNGGNGTGMFEMPWSAEGNSYKLVQFGATEVAGRWLARCDEVVIYGGCSNASTGVLRTHTPYGTMLGGFALNVSGPCFKKNYVLKMQIDEITVDCIGINMVKARCIIPINSIFRIGPTEVKVSVDAGRQYNYWNAFYISPPNLAAHGLKLIDDPLDGNNAWASYSAENLTLKWQAVNITTRPNTQVDLTLWGYWEDLRTHDFAEIGSIARNIPNTGVYSFDPRMLTHTDMLPDAWRKYVSGVIQVRVADDWMADLGNGIFWSKQIPFGFYYRRFWEEEYGEDFAINMCIEWYEEEGRKYQFWAGVEKQYSCPCTLDQAAIDFGAFIPDISCDMFGDGNCNYVTGAAHCILSTFGQNDGSAQYCCYNPEGWLMFSQDHEYDIGDDYRKLYGAGGPFRAHPFGVFPYKRPPYVPGLSHYVNDIMPQDICCNWAGRCEFYYWRRESSGCQEYEPPMAGFAYGDTHFITFDGLKYSFNGKGYFVLATMDSPAHGLMVQARMEQPPKTIWNTVPRSTVMTGIAAQDNGSAVVEIYARKEFRRWRYKMDVYAFGMRVFNDMLFKKIHYGGGLVIYNPARALNASVIWVLFQTGVGLRVAEDHGILSAQLMLPRNYNYTTEHDFQRQHYGGAGNTMFGILNSPGENAQLGSDFYAGEKTLCKGSYHTMGLMGTWDGDPHNDLMSDDCQITTVSKSPPTPEESRRIYQDFGIKWRVDGEKYNNLFSPRHKPIYDPLRFADPNYFPEFDPWRRTLGNASLILSRNQIKAQCQGMQSCEYDYFMTGRKEIALSTREIELVFDGIKGTDGQKLISCGPLQKNRGVLKFPPGNNYLDGVTVTFACQPEYYLHGDQTRTCINGTWSPGWWAWCRSRRLEEGLKIFTGLVISMLLLAVIGGILLWCYCVNVRGRKHRARHYQTRLGPPSVIRAPGGAKPQDHQHPPAQKHSHAEPAPKKQPPPLFDVPVMEGEPMKVRGGIHGDNPPSHHSLPQHSFNTNSQDDINFNNADMIDVRRFAHSEI